MPDFSSEAELKSYILKRTEVAVNSTADMVYDIIHEVLEKFYAYKPDYYKRTERLLRSLVKTRAVQDGDGYTAEIYFDVSKLDYPVSGWSSSTILDAAMEGSDARTWKNPTAVWEESFPKVDEKAISILVKELRAAGVPLQ